MLQAKLITSGLGANKIINSLTSLRKKQVYVGVPENTTRGASDVVTNPQLAFLHTHGVRASAMRRMVRARMVNRQITFEAATALYLQTYGSPLYQIPPRPIIEPAIEAKDNREAITRNFKMAAQASLDGKPGVAMTYLRLAGLEAQNRVRAWFTDPRNNWPPNAPSTIKRKGSDRPLIDTGQLRRSITYVVAEE